MVNSGMPAAGGQNNWSDKSANVKGSSDLYQQYPSQKQQQQPQYTDSKSADKGIINEIRQKIIARGARGINGIKRVFKIMDDNNSKTLDM